RLLFGQPARLVRLDWQRRLAVFEPGSVLGYERWQASTFGTVDWQIFIVETRRPGARVDDIAGIRPGAELLAAVHGKPGSKWMLAAVDAIRETSQSRLYDRSVWTRFEALTGSGLDPDLAARSVLAA
ncbi:MAG: DUF2840 domain-containing protein, partial [Pseudomonadota bacterium]